MSGDNVAIEEQLTAFLYRRMTDDFVKDILQCFADEYGPIKPKCKNFKGTGKPCDNLRLCNAMKQSISSAVVAEKRNRSNEFAQQKGPFYNVLDPVWLDEKKKVEVL